MSSLDWTSHAAELFRYIRGDIFRGIQWNQPENLTGTDWTPHRFSRTSTSRSSRVLFGQKIDRSQPLTANPDLLKHVFLQNQREMHWKLSRQTASAAHFVISPGYHLWVYFVDGCEPSYARARLARFFFEQLDCGCCATVPVYSSTNHEKPPYWPVSLPITEYPLWVRQFCNVLKIYQVAPELGIWVLQARITKKPHSRCQAVNCDFEWILSRFWSETKPSKQKSKSKGVALFFRGKFATAGTPPPYSIVLLAALRPRCRTVG